MRSLSRETKRVDRIIFHRLTDFRPSRTRRVAYAHARPVCKCACVCVFNLPEKYDFFPKSALVSLLYPSSPHLIHPLNNHDAANSVRFVRKERRAERKGFDVTFCHSNRFGLLIFTFCTRRNIRFFNFRAVRMTV